MWVSSVHSIWNPNRTKSKRITFVSEHFAGSTPSRSAHSNFTPFFLLFIALNHEFGFKFATFNSGSWFASFSGRQDNIFFSFPFLSWSGRHQNVTTNKLFRPQPFSESNFNQSRNRATWAAWAELKWSEAEVVQRSSLISLLLSEVSRFNHSNQCHRLYLPSGTNPPAAPSPVSLYASLAFLKVITLFIYPQLVSCLVFKLGFHVCLFIEPLVGLFYVPEARKQVKEATERLGGQYSANLSPQCTHLVVQISLNLVKVFKISFLIWSGS